VVVRVVTGDGIYAEFQSEQFLLGETLSWWLSKAFELVLASAPGHCHREAFDFGNFFVPLGHSKRETTKLNLILVFEIFKTKKKN